MISTNSNLLDLSNIGHGPNPHILHRLNHDNQSEYEHKVHFDFKPYSMETIPTQAPIIPSNDKFDPESAKFEFDLKLKTVYKRHNHIDQIFSDYINHMVCLYE